MTFIVYIFVARLLNEQMNMTNNYMTIVYTDTQTVMFCSDLSINFINSKSNLQYGSMTVTNKVT